jgi:hypothetical protein
MFVQAVAVAPACADLYVARAQVHLKKDDFTSVSTAFLFFPSSTRALSIEGPKFKERASSISINLTPL